VIADHLRASAFLIADGVLPSNEGRGYVLRRIMRRAMRHAELLGARQPLMWKLVPTLAREMGAAYPELIRAEPLIVETLKLEETRFRNTLERGLKILDEESSGLRKGDTFSGDTAFKLYDTYGFPLDLTQDALKPRGIGVDTEAFGAAMAKQRSEARRAWKGSGEAKTETVWFDIKERIGASEFLGYDTEKAEGVLKAIVADGKEVAALPEGERGSLVFNQTPFYGESGGQTGDHGTIKTAGAEFRVEDTQKRLGDMIIHSGSVQKGTISVGDAAELEVSPMRRTGNRQHHSATHLLHEALRQVLGSHVAQKGSLVEPGRLRFDFSHNKAMTPEEIAEVEQMANDIVLQNDPVITRLMSVDEAIAEGAMALFGEKYGEEVRVVSMGRNRQGSNRPAYSLELCGGTHVARTGDIGIITISSESASAAGVRRIEAFAGNVARHYLHTQSKRLQDVASSLRVSPSEVANRVETLMDERKKLERELAELRKQLAMGGGGGDGSGISDVAGVKFMGRILPGVDARDLKSLADEGKKAVGSGVVALIAVSPDGKGAVVVGVTDDLTKRYSAVDLVRVGSAALGGKGGGGRPDMAQAGGPDGGKADAAVAAIKQAVALA
jgi:alanyl-tRNA synthetase